MQAAPFMLVLIPFGTLFGVVAAETGLKLSQALGFSVLVLAGPLQFTVAVKLLTDHAPALVIIVSAIAVNLRMAMYLAALVPWLAALGRHASAA